MHTPPYIYFFAPARQRALPSETTRSNTHTRARRLLWGSARLGDTHLRLAEGCVNEASKMVLSSEVKLVSAAAGLYSSFLYWGYLQEKITGADYVSPADASVTGRWHYSFVLNGGWWVVVPMGRVAYSIRLSGNQSNPPQRAASLHPFRDETHQPRCLQTEQRLIMLGLSNSQHAPARPYYCSTSLLFHTRTHGSAPSTRRVLSDNEHTESVA